MLKCPTVKQPAVQVPHGGEAEERMPLRRDALKKSLLRSFELDTMAMVFIWECFNEKCNN